MNTYYIGGMPVTDELYHYGIPKMEHGNRRFQDSSGRYTEVGFLRYFGHPRYRNPDGSLTPEGKARYTKRSEKYEKKANENEKRLEGINNQISSLKDYEKRETGKWNEYESKRLQSTIKANNIRKRNDFLSNNLHIPTSDKSAKEYDKIARKFIDKQMDVERTLADIRLQLPYYESRAGDLVYKILTDKARSHEYAMLAEKGITKKQYRKELKNGKKA